MRSFTATSFEDGLSLPWCWEIPAIPSSKPIWGVNIVPTPQYAAYTFDPTGLQIGVGEPNSYTWSALLDPADTPLPDWITEVTPPPAVDVGPSTIDSASPGLIGSLKSVLSL